MGAWGTGPFENDDALDWAGELAAAPVVATVAAALELPPASADYPDAPDCSIAVAAAETVAAAKGSPGDDLPDEVVAFARTSPTVTPSLIESARSAVTRILAKSELRELWEDSDEFEGWRATLVDLQRRLRAG